MYVRIVSCGWPPSITIVVETTLLTAPKETEALVILGYIIRVRIEYLPPTHINAPRHMTKRQDGRGAPILHLQALFANRTRFHGDFQPGGAIVADSCSDKAGLVSPGTKLLPKVCTTSWEVNILYRHKRPAMIRPSLATIVEAAVLVCI
jgi:hypothetical protein